MPFHFFCATFSNMVVQRYSGKKRKTAPKTAYRIPRQVALNPRSGGYVGQEVKFYDSYKVSTVPNSFATGNYDPSTVNCLYAPTKGTGATNRNGLKTTIKSIHVQFDFAAQLLETSTGVRYAPSIFVAIVADRQANATQPSPGDVWEAPAAQSVAILPYRKLENASRFQVLYSKNVTIYPVWTQNGSDVYSQASGRKVWRWDKYFTKGMTVRHVADGGTVADISTNSIHLFAWMADTAHSDVLVYQSRVRFTG